MTDQRRLPEMEFIALTAMLFATIAFSIDAMLPALTIMGEELSPADPERGTLVIGIFVLGMGIGTFFAGPLSDAYGRKTIILGGYFFYLIGAVISALAAETPRPAANTDTAKRVFSDFICLLPWY